MISTDIRISVSFKDHRKRKRLRTLLGPGSTDYILDLWLATAMNHPSGILTGMDDLDIALEAGWMENPDIFLSALIQCGFLEKNDNGDYQIHDWCDHQEWVINAPARKEKARNAAKTRWATNSNVASMPHQTSKEDQEVQRECSEHTSSILEAMPQPTNKYKHCWFGSRTQWRV